MAATLAPSVRISVTGGQEGSDSVMNEEKGLRIKSRQPPSAVTESKIQSEHYTVNCNLLAVMTYLRTPLECYHDKSCVVSEQAVLSCIVR